MRIDEPKQNLDRLVLEIAIDNFVFFSSLQDSGKSHHGKRHTAVARLGGARVKEQDHAFVLAV
jgi:hypothetical protein